MAPSSFVPIRGWERIVPEGIPMKNSLLILVGYAVAAFAQFAVAEESEFFPETSTASVETVSGTVETVYESVDPSAACDASCGNDWCGESACGCNTCQPLCNSCCGQSNTKRCIDLKVALSCQWFCSETSGCLIPHYAYLPENHGHYYYTPYNYKTVLSDQGNVGDIGGNPLHPYSTEVFKSVYAENENTDYPGATSEGIILPLPRIVPQLPSLEEILKSRK
jgi:hypothetical protein